MSDELAPHQAALAALLGKTAPSPVQPIRDGWLTELKHDPARALDGLQRTVQEHSKDAATEKMLASLAMRLSVNNDAATPEYPGLRPCGSPDARPVLLRAGRLWRLCPEHRAAGARLQAVPAAPDGMPETCDFPLPAQDPVKFCDYCGNSDPRDLEPGIDGPQRPEMACRDDLLDECAARRERRYPPSLDRCPSWVFEAQARLTDEQSRVAILAACGLALRDYLELVAREDEETELELAQQQDDYALRGIPAGAAGAYDVQGGWHPVNFNWANWHWRHTIRGGAPMHRTIANQQFTPARISAAAAVSQARGAQAAPDGAQEGGQGRHEIPPTGIPEGVRQALRGDHVGGDVQTTPPQLPEGAPARPARDKYGHRRGRKAAYPKRTLKYSGRR